MTIEKGEVWGTPAEKGTPPSPLAADDAELAALAAEALAGGEHLVAGLQSGDLLRTLGLTDGRGEGDELIAYPMDLGFATLTVDAGGSAHETVPFVAHAIAGNVGVLAKLFGHGPGATVAVMNAAWFGAYRLGPRAHPNDGLLDITIGQVPFRHRREAARRARSGTHLPHPALKVQRVAAWSIDFSTPQVISVDGVTRGRASALSVEVVPDAFTVVA